MAPGEPGGEREPEVAPPGESPARPSQADAPASTDMGAGRAGDTPRPGDEAPPGKPSTGEDACPDCGGTGRLSGEQCPTCRGTGRVTEAVGGG